MTFVFNKSALRNGDWLHVRGTSLVSNFIRRGQNRMLRRICQGLDVPIVKVWGNHDGLIFYSTSREEWVVGEAIGRGSVVTSLRVYEKSMAAGKEQVRIYRAIDLTEHDAKLVCGNWRAHVLGRPYDFRGIFNLWV